MHRWNPRDISASGGSSPIPSTSAQPTRPFLRITQQPQSSIRFRYPVEERTGQPGYVLGIEICGYQGLVTVIVFCVTHDAPYRLHPHRLVSPGISDDGVCRVYVNRATSMEYNFDNLGIQCVRRRDMAAELAGRQGLLAEYAGYSYSEVPPDHYDIKTVRLCFQAIINGTAGQAEQYLEPVYTNLLHDSKAFPRLNICRLSESSAPAAGGKMIILLCDKVDKDDIRVLFTHNRPGRQPWVAYGTAQYVHKRYAISFLTPAYDDPNVIGTVMVHIQLERSLDQTKSQPLDFELIGRSSAMSSMGMDSAMRPSVSLVQADISSYSSNESSVPFLPTWTLLPPFDAPLDCYDAAMSDLCDSDIDDLFLDFHNLEPTTPSDDYFTDEAIDDVNANEM